MSQEPTVPVDEDLGPYMKTPLCTYCGHTGDVLDLSWSKVQKLKFSITGIWFCDAEFSYLVIYLVS